MSQNIYYFQQAHLVQRARITFINTKIGACLKQLSAETLTKPCVYLKTPLAEKLHTSQTKTSQILLTLFIPVNYSPVK